MLMILIVVFRLIAIGMTLHLKCFDGRSRFFEGNPISRRLGKRGMVIVNLIACFSLLVFAICAISVGVVESLTEIWWFLAFMSFVFVITLYDCLHDIVMCLRK
jgi:hypothetical protein